MTRSPGERAVSTSKLLISVEMPMMDEPGGIIHELLLTEEDYPNNYVQMHHPDDYKMVDSPITPEKVLVRRGVAHTRLILRKYTSVSFVCDTGAPGYLYLSKKAKDAIKSRIKEDEVGSLYIQVGGKKFLVHDSPAQHNSSNIVGLRALKIWGLDLSQGGDDSFEFHALPQPL
ncbi:hypothetical protein PROFUN_13125 [Planoprotostelium fungivorum]|uniref:Uncharacterized protein n=1 Tax=Planoprotostelium fungivorum TaxID=1890364 RepID=A0A2P6N522_9EUKA|nr:hypothetical protein PROFUN_13125 [Planoprotostelium fungivorum]